MNNGIYLKCYVCGEDLRLPDIKIKWYLSKKENMENIKRTIRKMMDENLWSTIELSGANIGFDLCKDCQIKVYGLIEDLKK